MVIGRVKPRRLFRGLETSAFTRETRTLEWADVRQVEQYRGAAATGAATLVVMGYPLVLSLRYARVASLLERDSRGQRSWGRVPSCAWYPQS